MRPYSLFVTIAIALSLFLALYVLAKGKRRLAKTNLALLMVFLAIFNLSFLLRTENLSLDGILSGIGMASGIIFHPFIPIFVLSHLHGSSFLLKKYIIPMLLAPAFAFSMISPWQGWVAEEMYSTNYLTIYLALCLALAMAESIAVWHKSMLKGKDSFHCMVAVVILIVSGPIYSYELQFLNASTAIGSNLGAPFAGLVFAYSLMSTNSLPFKVSLVGEGEEQGRYSLSPGKVYLIEERRPKIGYTIFACMVKNGYAGLLFTSRRSEKNPKEPDSEGARVVQVSAFNGEVKPTQARIVDNTIVEFVYRQRRPVIFLDDLSYLVTNSDIASISEMISDTAKAVSGSHGIGLFSLSHLSPEERKALEEQGMPLIKVPNIEDEIQTVMKRHIGDATAYLLQKYCSAGGKRIEELTLEDIPSLKDFLSKMMLQFGRSTADGMVFHGWQNESRRLIESLNEIYQAELSQLAKRPWAEKRSKSSSEQQFVVMAGGEEKPERFDYEQISRLRAKHPPLPDRLLEIFTQSLGHVGKQIFEKEVRKLGKSPKDLGLEDLPKLAKGAQEAIFSLSGLIDLEAGRKDMVERANCIKGKIMSLAGGIDEES